MATARERKRKIVEKVKAKTGNRNPKLTATSKVDLEAIVRRQSIVADLHRRCHTQYEIKAELARRGIVASQPTISNDIRAMIADFTNRTDAEMEALRAEQIARLHHIKKTAWDEFEFSRQRTIKIKPRKGDPDQEERVIVERCEGNIEWTTPMMG